MDLEEVRMELVRDIVYSKRSNRRKQLESQLFSVEEEETESKDAKRHTSTMGIMKSILRKSDFFKLPIYDHALEKENSHHGHNVQ